MTPVPEDCSSKCVQTLPNHVLPSKSKVPPWWRSCRYLVAMMQFWGMAVVVFQRNHFNVALVCMVNHTAVELQRLATLQLANGNSSLLEAEVINGGNASYENFHSASDDAVTTCRDVAEARKEDGPYVWSRDVQGVLLGAMFWSYMALQLPGAILAERFLSVKTTTTAAVAAMSLIHLFVPLLAEVSPWTVLMARILVGLFLGFYQIAFFKIWSLWAPPAERGRLMYIANGGIQLANTFVFPLSAFLCRSQAEWPAVFYVFACLGLVWCVLSLVLVYESPDVHPRISPEERDYIVSAIANSTSKQRKDDVPWRKILTSAPLTAITVGIFAFNWATSQMIVTLPMFMREVLKFDIRTNGAFSMLPMLASWAGIYLSGFAADRLIQNHILSISWTRKLVQAVGQITSALCLVAVSCLDCRHQGAAVALLTLCMGALSVNFTILPVNIFDVAPKYFYVCYAVSNTIGVVPGIFAPIFVAEMTKDKTREQWQITFFVTAAIMVAGSVVFVTFGQGHPLSWATGESRTIAVGAEPTANGLSEFSELRKGDADDDDVEI